jgi:glycosyltransferase involved in cell wall biosynthesis
VAKQRTVSIVMTYFDRMAQLFASLRSFQLHNYEDFELIIVDDASVHEPLSEDLFNSLGFPVKLVVMPKKKKYLNPCIPFNTGFARANGEIIIIQNAECIHLDNILEHARNILTEKDYFSYSCYSFSEEKTFALITQRNWNLEQARALLTMHKGAGELGEDAWYNHSIYRPRSYHFTSAISSRNLEVLGGFDPRYSQGIGHDDNEFVLRIARLGLNKRIIDDHTVIHQWHYTMPKIPHFDGYAARNSLLYHFVTRRENTTSIRKISLYFILYRFFRGLLVVLYLIRRFLISIRSSKAT